MFNANRSPLRMERADPLIIATTVPFLIKFPSDTFNVTAAPVLSKTVFISSIPAIIQSSCAMISAEACSFV